MATWFYYNENGDKIQVTGRQLKGLAKNGHVTPETIVETEEGKQAPAGKVKGLTFGAVLQPETVQPKPISQTSFSNRNYCILYDEDNVGTSLVRAVESPPIFIPPVGAKYPYPHHGIATDTRGRTILTIGFLSIIGIGFIGLIIMGIVNSLEREAMREVAAQAEREKQEAEVRAEQEREREAWERSPAGRMARAAQERETAARERMERVHAEMAIVANREAARERRDAATRAAQERAQVEAHEQYSQGLTLLRLGIERRQQAQIIEGIRLVQRSAGQGNQSAIRLSRELEGVPTNNVIPLAFAIQRALETPAERRDRLIRTDQWDRQELQRLRREPSTIMMRSNPYRW